LDYIKGKTIPVIRTLTLLLISAMLLSTLNSIYGTKYSFNGIIPKYKIFIKRDIHPVEMLPIIIGPMENIFNILFLTLTNMTDKILPISMTNVICAHAPVSLSLPFDENQTIVFVYLSNNSEVTSYGFKSKLVKFLVQYIYMEKISKNKLLIVMPSGVVLEVEGNFKTIKPGSFGAYIYGKNVKLVGIKPLPLIRGTVNWLCLIKEKQLLY